MQGTRKIIYYASDDTMGNTSADDCSKFRDWAKKELSRRFPDYEIVVNENNSLRTVDFDCEIEPDEQYYIELVCGELWDKCPWDWMEDNASN